MTVKGVLPVNIERDLGVTYVTAHRMLKQIRIAMGNRETEQVFEAVVEIDETYVDGTPRKGNAILDDKGNVIHRTVVGIKERNSTNVYAQVMLSNEKGQKLTGKQLFEVIEKVCKNKTTVITDDLSSYKILESRKKQKKYTHLTINHSKGEYYRDGIHTNGIENF